MTQMVVTEGRVPLRAPGNSHRILMRGVALRRRLRGRWCRQPRPGHRHRLAAQNGRGAADAGVQAQGRFDGRSQDFRQCGLHRLPHAGRRACDRDGRPEPRHRHPEAGLPPRDGAGHTRQGRDAVVQGPADGPADRRRRRVRREGDRRHAAVATLLELPATFPKQVAAFAVDLDRTLIAGDAVLRPHTREAIARVRATGTHVIVVTGRMFRAVLPYLAEAELDDPVICYQGAVVADPVTGEFLRHIPIPEREAREVIATVEALGYTILVYVDDELYVARETPESDAYAVFQHLVVHAVGDLLAWLPQAPT